MFSDIILKYLHLTAKRAAVQLFPFVDCGTSLGGIASYARLALDKPKFKQEEICLQRFAKENIIITTTKSQLMFEL